MKRIYKHGIIFTLLFLMAAVNGMAVNAQTKTRELVITAETKSKTRIKLGWKKKTAAQYRVYRASVKGDGSTGRFKRIAAISGRNTSFTDKVPFKKHYVYKVNGYRKKGGSLEKIYSGEQYAYSGMGDADWKEYHYCDAAVSPKAIPIEVYLKEGFVPTAYEIYRSTDGKNYKKLIVIRKKAMSLKYKDKKVKSGQSYFYKVRAYRLTGGKKCYGRFTDSIRLSAVNASGEYKAQILTEENASVSFLTVRMTSDEENAELRFTNDYNNELTFYSEKEGAPSYVDMKIAKYSYDNRTWNPAGNKKSIIVKPGKSIYLQFVPVDGKTFPYQISGKESAVLEYINVEYNELSSLLFIDLKHLTAKTELNGELYH